MLDTACARVAINLSSPPKQISALTTLSHQQEAEIRQLERELRIGLRTDTSRMTEVLVQYDETLTALDELEAAWHQQQTLVREIIALRQQLLGVAEDDAAPLPDADTVEDTQPESEQDNTGAKLADEAGSEQPEETAETVSPVQRLAQLTAELDALHNDRLLVSPHVDKKQIAAVIAEWTGVPLNPRSAQDASLDAFERFFKPDGILDTFYQQNLKLFIDNDLSLEDGDNNVIIREDIIAQLETAQKIRDIFFSKQNGLGTSFAVETVSLSGNKRRSVLNLDGQLVDYSQGRNYTAHLVWPNNMREGNESKLTLIGTSGNAPRSISFSGPWAQFRLFGAGQLTGVQDGNFTVRFSVDGGAMTYRVHTDTEDNPFSGGLFSQFGLSDTLY